MHSSDFDTFYIDAKNEINLFNHHILIVAPVTFAPAGAMTPSAEFLYRLIEAIQMSTHMLFMKKKSKKNIT